MTRMRYMVWLLALALLLAACGGSPPPSTDQAVATIGAGLNPGVAITPPALTDLALEPILVQPGDLPAGVSGAQVRDTLPQMFSGLPAPTKAIYQQFARDGKQVGGVAVLLYEQDARRDSAYQAILKGMGETTQASGVGDRAAVTTAGAIGPLAFVDLIFARCAAVSHIRFSGDGASADAAAAYAKRLDQRLKPLICR